MMFSSHGSHWMKNGERIVLRLRCRDNKLCKAKALIYPQKRCWFDKNDEQFGVLDMDKYPDKSTPTTKTFRICQGIDRPTPKYIKKICSCLSV